MLSCGFSESGVRTLIASGRLHGIHRGVYAFSPAALTREGNLLAAVLACRQGSLLNSRSAAGHRGLITNSSSVIDVMCTHRVRRPGIRAHAMAALAPQDRTTHLAIPCTSIARTLLDLAALGRPGELEGALAQAEALGLFDLFALRDVLARNPGARGARRLRSALPSLAEERPEFASEFERKFLPITRSAGMPEPLVNHAIQLPDGTIEVDYYWPALRLVVELDGYRFHRHHRSFRDDRRRDRRLAAAGIHCLRYVWEDLEDRSRIERELQQVRLHRELSFPSSRGTELSPR
jgi:very-short-patch-repair endonuclease